MNVFVTGATGYIGGSVAAGLRAHGHHVSGLARSPETAGRLRERGITPVHADLADLDSLTSIVRDLKPDAVISAARFGASAGDTAASFARDRRAVSALLGGFTSSHQTFVFTSGSAVFGRFRDGEAAAEVASEDATLPLAPSIIAPRGSGMPSLLAIGFGEAMAARAATEQAVLTHSVGRGIVIRPGLVYGHGGSYDLPALIALSRAHGRGVHLGTGATTQSFVHVDDLAELYRLALEQDSESGILHGVTAEVTQRQLAGAVGRMLGVGDATKRLTFHDLLGLRASERAGVAVAGVLPASLQRRISAGASPSARIGLGISLSLNKRLSSERTRALLGWRPLRTDIVKDIESGSYLGRPRSLHPGDWR